VGRVTPWIMRATAVADDRGFGRRLGRVQSHFGGALSYADSGGGWILEGRAFHSDGLSPGLFSALSRLREIFPALGDGAFPRAGGNVTASPVIAVTGLKTEARLVAGPRVYAIAKKASAIISFGVAGGLAPGLAPGSALIARAIISEDGTRYSSDPVWSKWLSSALGGRRNRRYRRDRCAAGWA
jgi:Phosphorylase superfamily